MITPKDVRQRLEEPANAAFEIIMKALETTTFVGCTISTSTLPNGLARLPPPALEKLCGKLEECGWTLEIKNHSDMRTLESSSSWVIRPVKGA